ncbi:hypothetical protein [Streptomyces sp. NPDC054784]
MRAAVAGLRRRLRRRLGRRGVFLLIVGAAEICWGVSFLVAPPPAEGLGLLTRWCDIRHWSWLWIICGAGAALSAFLRIGRDWAGFVAALAPPAVWATAYAVAILDGSYPRGAWVAAWYIIGHVLIILWAATVPEYSVPPPPRRVRKGASE